jgi:Rieske Fe-S protein
MTDRDELDESMPTPEAVRGTSRRAVLLGAGAAGAVGMLAACGDSPAPAGTGAPVAATTKAEPPVIKVADIPVGGGKIYPNIKVVVTQPSSGQFRAFDATCQHAGCLVADIKGGVIICPCHGSTYNVADGSVHEGPTTKPLPPKTATVSGDTIVVS